MQSKVDSIMEAVTNTAIGFVLSTLMWIVLDWAYGITMSWNVMFQSIGWFTVLSIARQYVLRRLFDGRSVWQAIKDKAND